MIQKKTISKTIMFFYYEQFSVKTINKVLKFLENRPKSVNSDFSDGTNILLDSITFKVLEGHFTSIVINFNIEGRVKAVKLEPKRYYYFKGGEITSVENPDDVVFWG